MFRDDFFFVDLFVYSFVPGCVKTVFALEFVFVVDVFYCCFCLYGGQRLLSQ